MKILLATANTHKADEMAELLGAGYEIVTLHEFPETVLPPETSRAMHVNARLKAEYCRRVTGLPSLADDSGIEVDALGGAPGVLSARWVAGSDFNRTRALLDRLGDVPTEQRTARYRCALCFVMQGGRRLETEAVCEGAIAREMRGENGFGYDPIFEITLQTGTPPGYSGATLAEAPPAVKALVSHRARAVAMMKNLLAKRKLRETS